MIGLKVYIEAKMKSYADMFKARGWTVVDSVAKADLVQFTGGEDVSPELYLEQAHPYSQFNIVRDRVCMGIYQTALLNNIPMAGICRGGQFLNVMNGGKMYQDVDGHLGTHEAYLANGQKLMVSSTHHQMMRPDVDGIVLLTANQSTRREYMDTKGELVRDLEPAKNNDVEAILYESTNCLCYQPHPEIMSRDSDCQELYFKFLAKIGVE